MGFNKVLNLFRVTGDTTYAYGPAINFDLYTGKKDKPWAFIMTPQRSGIASVRG